MINRNNAVFYLALTAALWSTGGVLIKLVNWNAMAVAGVRSLIAAAVIWLFFCKQEFKLSKIDWAGAVCYSALVSLFVAATKLTTAANAILLQYTAPIYVALLSGWLLGEKTTRRDWATICLVFIGMMFFFVDKVSVGGMLGNIFAIASGVIFALFIIFSKMQPGKPPYPAVLLGNLLTFAISLPFLPGISVDFSNIAGILLLGVLQLGLAYVIYTYSVQHVRALEATLITTVEPILNPIWVFLIMGEAPGIYALLGGFIVVISIVGGYCLKLKGAVSLSRSVVSREPSP